MADRSAGRRRRRRVGTPGPRLIAAVASVGLSATACTAGLPAAAHSPATRPVATSTVAPATAAPTTATTEAPTTTSSTTTTTTTLPANEAGWTVVSSTARGPVVDERVAYSSSGAKIILLRFRAGRIHLDLHVGSTDPPIGGASIPANAASAVSAAERPSLVAAFNGGFKSGAGAGGFEVAGQALRPLEAGIASLVIYSDGSAGVGVWGQGVPVAGRTVASVRQNLPPLVVGGRPSSSIGSIYSWGATIRGLYYVARSAIGSDAGGSLVYAASTSAEPSDLANALISAGCMTAMELDINPEWVQADVAPAPGASLEVALPGQSRPAGQYLYGWTRDFVTVLAAG